jgi:hypothetical protein
MEGLTKAESYTHNKINLPTHLADALLDQEGGCV